MAIAKLLHEGETIRQLKSVIKYNTIAKTHLNSASNPRLLQAFSNLGIIDITDAKAYQQFMNSFVDEITLNQKQSTNKRQIKLYAHEVISFEDEDNARFSQDALAQISIELLSSLYDMENTPYVIWPQTDSGRLHFHFIRSMFSSNGSYQRVKNSKRKMRVACEKIEKKYNLTLTGNNVSNKIRPANDPMAKVIKNRMLETEYTHTQNLSKAKDLDSSLTKLKRNTYNLLMEGTYKSEMEVAEHSAYEQVQQNLTDKVQVNQKLEAVKQTIFNLFKSVNDEEAFIEQLEKQEISIEILKHSKSGKNKGIVFHYKGETISGGKISNSMTLGKIKNRFPNFIHTLEKPPLLRPSHRPQRKVLDFKIEQINKHYKQRRNNQNGDILIYFDKKNIEARPFNYNLKLSSNKDLIRFGPSIPNQHDLALSINVALVNGWKGAILTNSNPVLLKKMMKTAYEKDPKLLFFVKPNTLNQLSYADLQEIKPSLTIGEIKTALTNNLITKSDISMVYQDLIRKLKEDDQNQAHQGYAKALMLGFKLEELEKKTKNELVKFYHSQSFQSKKSDTTAPTTALQKNNNKRAACLDALREETRMLSPEPLIPHLNEKKKHRYDL